MDTRRKKSAVIFDFDGTLVDSMGGFASIASDVICESFGCSPEWARKKYLETSGLPFSFQIEKIFPGDERNADAVLNFNFRKKMFYEECRFFDDVEPSLLRLKKDGILVAVSSNNDTAFLERKSGVLSHLFDCMAGYRPGFLKGRLHFEWLAKNLKIPFSEMIFVGDSMHDAVIARENDIEFYARLGTFAKSDFAGQGIAVACLESLHDLKDIIPCKYFFWRQAVEPAWVP